jgi:hypothetical protein
MHACNIAGFQIRRKDMHGQMAAVRLNNFWRESLSMHRTLLLPFRGLPTCGRCGSQLRDMLLSSVLLIGSYSSPTSPARCGNCSPSVSSRPKPLQEALLWGRGGRTAYIHVLRINRWCYLNILNLITDRCMYTYEALCDTLWVWTLKSQNYPFEIIPPEISYTPGTLD